MTTVAGRALRGGSVVLVAGLLALLVWHLAHQPTRPKDGQAAPGFRLPLLNHPGSLSLQALRGRPVVINFWSSTCAPCKSEASTLERLYLRNRHSGLTVLGVDPQDFNSDARRFIQAHHITYPNVKDTGEGVANSYGIDGTPETFLVDRRGRVIQDLIGPIDAGANRELLATDLRRIMRA